MKDEQIKQEKLEAFALEDEKLEDVSGGLPTLGGINIPEPTTGENISDLMKKTL